MGGFKTRPFDFFKNSISTSITIVIDVDVGENKKATSERALLILIFIYAKIKALVKTNKKSNRRSKMEEKLKSCGIQISLIPKNKLARDYRCRTEGCETQLFTFNAAESEEKNVYQDVVGFTFTKGTDFLGFLPSEGVWVLRCPYCNKYYWTHAYDVEIDILKEIQLWDKSTKHLK
ncbi:MAG: hypothetical protein PHT40_00505 [Patescibacteria group bacterium]|nr:hypothetical protein [Patescibacteria group bacterium]